MINDVLSLLSNIWILAILFASATLLIRIQYLEIRKKQFILHRELIIITFVVYLLSLYHTVTFDNMNLGTMNLEPFAEILRYEIGSNLFYKNVVGNIILFIPFGFYIAYFLKIKDFIYLFFVSILLSSIIEVSQSMIGRVFDIDDIILNVFGTFIGFIVFRIIYKIKNVFTKKLMSDSVFYFFLFLGLIGTILIAIYYINLEVLM